MTAPDLRPDSDSVPPTHIAIIMDGNGRWAKRRGLPRLVGHREGRKAVRRVVQGCGELGVKFLTLYAFSAENWQRAQPEVRGLMELIERVLRAELDELHRSNVRIVGSGRLAELPPSLREALDQAFVRTRDNTGLTLNLALNYSGRCELVDAMRKLAAQAAGGSLAAGEVDEVRIHSALYQPQIPDPDLLIRTGGEMRLSNFLLWQIAYTELYVTDVLWPDFERKHLEEAIAVYHQRERRFGRVPAAAQG